MKRNVEENTLTDWLKSKYTKLETNEEIVLSPEQQFVLDCVENKENVFFTGPAGAGKSTVIKQLIHRHADLVLTAPTGIAAANIGGRTIHSFAGIGTGQNDVDVLISKLSFTAKLRWKKVKILVIDEVSMLSAELFDKLELIARAVRNSSAPFGGICVVLCGDFYQLPPVVKSIDKKQEPLFCYQSRVWKKVVQREIQLKHVYRQKDPTFAAILNQFREGMITPEGIEMISKREVKWIAPEEEDPLKVIAPTRLFATNNEADYVNRISLEAVLKAHPEFTKEVYNSCDYCSSPEYQTLLDQVVFPKVLELCIGAQVICLINLQDSPIVNGSRGVVVGFISAGKKNVPLIKFANMPHNIPFNVATHDNKDKDDNTLYSRRQIPLKLAWALSIHKSQGMSIDLLEVDLTSVFEFGQGYVALSRARNLEGLYVKGFNGGSKIYAHPSVKEFYSHLS